MIEFIDLSLMIILSILSPIPTITHIFVLILSSLDHVIRNVFCFVIIILNFLSKRFAPPTVIS